MTVREATIDDRDGIVLLGRRFLRELLGPSASVERVMETVDQCFAKGAIYVADARDGQIVGVLGFVYVTALDGVLTAAEVAWYLDASARGHGLGRDLVRVAEGAAALAGARRFQIGSPSEPVGRLLDYLGYRVIETQFAKELA